GLLGLVPGAAAYEPDVFGTAGQVAGQAVYDLGGSGLPCRGGPPPTELSLEEAIERILCHDPQTRLAWANAKAQARRVCGSWQRIRSMASSRLSSVGGGPPRQGKPLP
ncbi:hypothetical protein ACV35F_34455, partial [Pseudomonas aeruginosa]